VLKTTLRNRSSIYHYLEEYASKKKTNNDDTNSSGRPPKLSLEQEGELKEHLEKNIYESTVAVVDYIRERYGVSFSRGGLAKWLNRNGFRYKRPKRVPYTVDVEKPRSIY
jgi:transposase